MCLLIGRFIGFVGVRPSLGIISRDEYPKMAPIGLRDQEIEWENRQATAGLRFGVKIEMRPCDRIIRKTLELAERMKAIADEGDAVREDVNCGVLYGILRDSAFKIARLAEEEKAAHMRKGLWLEDDE